MNELGIENKKLKSELLVAKDRLTIKQNYSEFKEILENKNFKEALSMVQTDWKDSYATENNKVIVCNILDKALNNKVEELLKNLSDINDVDAFNDNVKILNNIKDLQNNTSIKKVNYTATLNQDNKDGFDEKWREYEKYSNVLNNGIVPKSIAFGAEYEENEPLGFKCGEEDEIILTIDTKIYHFDNQDSCRKGKISWRDSQKFKSGNYTVKVVEEDIADDDEYFSSFSVNNNDLIKLLNNEPVKKDIGKEYYIEIGN
jgi:F0F1-type ATP synthase delta subunit